MASPEFDAAYHAEVCTHALRGELLHLYLDQGIPAVRDKLNGFCPGCITDLIVGYVVGAADDALAEEFGLGD